MLGELSRLGRETAVYGLSTVLGRLLNFVLLPLYTHALAPSDYGVVATLFSFIALLNVVYGHGMDFAFMRHYKAQDGSTDRRAFTTALLSLAAVALPLSALAHALAGPLAEAAQIAPRLRSVVVYSAWILAADALALVPFAALRMAHRPYVYSGLKVVNIALNLALTYVFLVRLRLGVEGVFLANLVSSCATLGMLAPIILVELAPVFDVQLHRSMLRFALPLIPAGLASMLVQVINRPILRHFTDDATVGLFQANYRLGIFMMMLVNMFDAAWRPFFLQRADKPGAGALFGRVLTYWVAGAGVVLVGLSLFIAHIAALPLPGGRTLIHPSYWSGLPIVPLVTLAYLINGVYVNLLAPVTIAKRSELVAAATALGAVVSVAANVALIPRWGMFGAAAASLAAYSAMAAALFALGRRLYPVAYEWRRLAHACAVLAGTFAAARALGLGVSADRPLTRLVLVGAVPLALVLTGFLSEDERQAARRRLHGLY